MAPFVDRSDAAEFLLLTAVVLLAAFGAHRAARACPAVRRRLPEWESWRRREFPMGLALGLALVAYLALKQGMT